MEISSEEVAGQPIVKLRALPETITHTESMTLSGHRGLACINTYSFKGDAAKVIIILLSLL